MSTLGYTLTQQDHNDITAAGRRNIGQNATAMRHAEDAAQSVMLRFTTAGVDSWEADIVRALGTDRRSDALGVFGKAIKAAATNTVRGEKRERGYAEAAYLGMPATMRTAGPAAMVSASRMIDVEMMTFRGSALSTMLASALRLHGHDRVRSDRASGPDDADRFAGRNIIAHFTGAGMVRPEWIERTDGRRSRPGAIADVVDAAVLASGETFGMLLLQHLTVVDARPERGQLEHSAIEWTKLAQDSLKLDRNIKVRKSVISYLQAAAKALLIESITHRWDGVTPATIGAGIN